MASRTKLPPPKHFQSTIEWRYPRAHRYWDDSGKLISLVEATFPGLRCDGLEVDGFTFKGRSRGATLAKFFWDKSSLTQQGLGDAGLADAAAMFWPLVRNGLGIESLNFVGHRTWLMFETDRLVEAVRHIDGMRVWSFAANNPALGVPVATGTTLRTHLEPNGRRLRLHLDGATAAVDSEKNIHGVVADVDIVLQGDVLGSIEPDKLRELVGSNIRFLKESIIPLVREGK